MKISEPRGETEAYPWTTETKKDHIRWLRRAASLWLHCSSLKLAQWHTDRVPLGLQFLQWKKENLRWTSSSPIFAGYFLRNPLRSHLMGFTEGIFRVWPLEIRYREEVQGLLQPTLRSWRAVFLLAVVPEQRAQSAALSICRVKAVGRSLLPGSFIDRSARSGSPTNSKYQLWNLF